MKDEPLVMTYSSSKVSVRDVLRNIREDELAEIIKTLGGERYAKRVAAAIKRKRIIETSGELAEIVRSALPRNYERGRIDPATRTFQALRIYANEELENLERAIEALPRILKSGGRVVIISFHSLEDKIVKNGFRQFERQNILRVLTKKPIIPTPEEEARNPRARSAKLRAAVMV